MLPASLAIGATLLLTLGSGPAVLADPLIPLTVSFTANDHVYDGGVTTGVSACAIAPEGIALAHPDVTCDFASATGTFDAGKNVGTGLAVTGSGFVPGGPDAAHYTVATVQPSTANITQAPLTVSATGINKVYDSLLGAIVTLSDTRIFGDVFTDSYTSASFADKNVGTGKAVSVSGIAITGADAANYSFNSTASTTADIAQRDLTVDATGVNRGYNGTTTATVTFTDDRVLGDVVSTAYTANFNNRNAGNGKSISVTAISISDTDAANYHLTSTTDSTSANVAKATLTVTAVANIKTADGGISAAGIPTVAGTIYASDAAAFLETYDTQAAGSGKTLTPSGVVNDANGGLNYSYAAGTFVAVNTGQIRPAAVDHLTFSAQPIDTMINTPIYDVCRPSGGIGDPCATVAAVNPLIPSIPVKVTAYDQFNNVAGPGAPGADVTTRPISIAIYDNSASGTQLNGGVPTSNGDATFGDSLKINATKTTKLWAVATQTSPSASASLGSSPVRIVSTLKACSATTICTASVNGTFSPKSGVSLPQGSYGKIEGMSNLYTPDGATNLLLTTNFLPDASSVNGQCTVTTKNGKNSTIGDAVELRITGVGINNPAPKSTMLVILPKMTLQYYGVSSRNAAAFNVCLGAINLNSPTAASSPWKSISPTGVVGTASTSAVPASVDPDGLYRYWGVPASCTASGVTDSDPCITLKTKSASVVATQLGWTATQVATIFKDGDIGIFIFKPNPWDGKGGVY